MKKTMNRRDFLKKSLTLVSGLSLISIPAFLTRKSIRLTVWQVDPYLCVQCGRCATECVLTPSAVKCVHAFEVCGYCDLCSGYLRPDSHALDTGAENRLCPTKAIQRTFIEDPYFEYTINEKLCIGCGKCVKGCGAFGNGSLYLQIRHDRCINCNECLIAQKCPSMAVKRISATQGYILKGQGNVKS
ncbi:MAG: ferredoxin [Spirochaetes bacterium]|nr:ferredoxin [Spirochaetota bacterium]